MPEKPLPPMQGDMGRPYYLPQASRAQMHECAIAWQQKKLDGSADDMTWRMFAAECLTAAARKPEAIEGGPQKK